MAVVKTGPRVGPNAEYRAFATYAARTRTDGPLVVNLDHRKVLWQGEDRPRLQDLLFELTALLVGSDPIPTESIALALGVTPTDIEDAITVLVRELPKMDVLLKPINALGLTRVFLPQLDAGGYHQAVLSALNASRFPLVPVAELERQVGVAHVPAEVAGPVPVQAAQLVLRAN